MNTPSYFLIFFVTFNPFVNCFIGKLPNNTRVTLKRIANHGTVGKPNGQTRTLGKLFLSNIYLDIHIRSIIWIYKKTQI